MSEEPKDWVLRKLGYFYRPNSQGYTSEIHDAGRYTEAEAKAHAAEDIEPAVTASHESQWLPPGIDNEDHMIQIAKLIADMQEIQRKFGNTCVYIRRGGVSWGAVALNRRDDDKKNGVFDLQAQHDRDMLARVEQIERLMKDRDEWRERAWNAEKIQEQAAVIAETVTVPCDGHPQIDAPTIGDARRVIATAIRELKGIP